MGVSPPNESDVEEAVKRVLFSLSEANETAEERRLELSRMETDHEEEKKILMSKIIHIEQQLQLVQNSAINKEEEL